MHSASKVLGSFQFALNERLVNDDLGCDVRQFTSLPSFDLLSHRFEVALHAVDSNRDAVDERDRLGVFSKDGRKHTSDNVSRFGSPEY